VEAGVTEPEGRFVNFLDPSSCHLHHLRELDRLSCLRTVPGSHEREERAFIVLLWRLALDVLLVPKRLVIDVHLDESFDELLVLAHDCMVEHIAAVEIRLSQCLVSEQFCRTNTLHQGKDHLHIRESNCLDECSLLFVVFRIDSRGQHRARYLTLLYEDHQIKQELEDRNITLFNGCVKRSHTFEVRSLQHLGGLSTNVAFYIVDSFSVLDRFLDIVSVLQVLDEQQFDIGRTAALDSEVQGCHSFIVLVKQVDLRNFS